MERVVFFFALIRRARRFSKLPRDLGKVVYEPARRLIALIAESKGHLAASAVTRMWSDAIEHLSNEMHVRNAEAEADFERMGNPFYVLEQLFRAVGVCARRRTFSWF